MDGREAILKTLLYSDLFDYPLKKEEIYKFLISERKINQNTINQKLNLIPQIEEKKGFFFIKGKKNLVLKRLTRKKESEKKLKIAKQIIKKLEIIPTIKFIGISGALSMQNCEKEDDIDIFIISKNGFVWTTRLLVVLRLILSGGYRFNNRKIYKNKICPNMIIDEKNNKLGSNIFNAHEISQLLPIFDRDDTYETFINLNSWTKKILPNINLDQKPLRKKTTSKTQKFLISLFRFFQFERILESLQKIYMKRHITKEIIKPGFLAFHPFDYKSHILFSYKKSLKKYRLEN